MPCVRCNKEDCVFHKHKYQAGYCVRGSIILDKKRNCTDFLKRLDDSEPEDVFVGRVVRYVPRTNFEMPKTMELR